MKKILLVIAFLSFYNIFLTDSLGACCFDEISSSPFATNGNNPEGASYSPDGHCLAVANFDSNTVSVFRINPIDCSLTQVPGSPFPTGAVNPTGVAFSPNGLCLAVTNFGSGNITIFTVNPISCVLSPIAITATGGSNPKGVAYSPDGSCLAVSNFGSGNVSIFSVNPMNCAIAAIGGSPFSTGSATDQPAGLAYSPDGGCLAVTRRGPDDVLILTVNPDCSINLPGTPFSTGAASNPIAVAYSPNGRCLSVTNQGLPGSVAVFTVNPDCSLSALSGSPFFNLGTTEGIAYSTSGQCLAVSDRTSNQLHVFNVNQNTCAITEAAGSPFTTTSPHGVSFSIDNCLAVANRISGGEVDPAAGTVSIFSPVFPIAVDQRFQICANQILRAPAPGVLTNAIFSIPNVELFAELVLGPSFGKLILNEDGSFVYLAACNFTGRDIFSFRINANGSCSSNIATVIIDVCQCCH